jgi:hypothetical protein
MFLTSGGSARHVNLALCSSSQVLHKCNLWQSMSTIVKTIFLSLASRTSLLYHRKCRVRADFGRLAKFDSSTYEFSRLHFRYQCNHVPWQRWTERDNLRSAHAHIYVKDKQGLTVTATPNPALDCLQSSSDWTSASSSWFDNDEHWTTFTTTTEYDKFTTLKDYNCTSSGGTLPGAISYCGPATVTTITEHRSTAFKTRTKIATQPVIPKPKCTVANSDCSALQTSYTSALDEYLIATTSMASPVRPACSYCIATACTFSYGAMDFYFYPVTTNVSRDMCTNVPEGGYENSVTVTGDPDTSKSDVNSAMPSINSHCPAYTEVTTGPATVVNGVTMYEGNVYMSFDDPRVIDNCQQSVLPKYQKPRILTMASSDVYSVIAYPHNMLAYSIKYADFNEPVPWSAYYFQSYCWNNHIAVRRSSLARMFPSLPRALPYRTCKTSLTQL